MNIKKRVPGGIKAAFILAMALCLGATGIAQEPGQIVNDAAYLHIDEAFDFSKIQPVVNVHLPKFLLNNMLAELDGSPDDPFAELGINIADLTRDIQLIRVVVIEAKDQQKQAIVKSGIKKLKETMSSKWMPIVNVPDGNVTIYAMGDETGQRMAGLAMMVAEKNSAVIGNIIGEVQIGKIIAAATQVVANSKNNPKAQEFLQKLMGGIQPPPSPAPKPSTGE